MIRYAAALSQHPIAVEAAGEVLGAVLEQLDGARPDLVVLHDSEDIIDPRSFAVYARFMLRYDFIQVPVFSLIRDRRDLVASERIESQGLHAEITRRLEDDRVIKRIRILRAEGDVIHEERVRLYERENLGASLGRLGFSTVAVLGDERGGAYDPGSSPRMSLLLRRDT